MKPGRNDPCPCGSGRKHKHCCLERAQTAAQSPDELLWRGIRRELEGFPTRMFRFMLETYGEQALEEAWGEFILWDEHYGGFDPESAQIPVFVPWMYHCWAPHPDQGGVVDSSLHGMSPTRTFLARKGRHLSPLLRAYLEACVEAQFGFLEILHSDPGRGLRVCDFFSGETFDVRESSASRTLQAGDLLYAQPVRVRGLVMLEACSPVAIPPERKIELIRLRQELQADFDATPEARAGDDWKEELRAHYLAESDAILHPAQPQLSNTDGDELVLQRLVFDVESPQRGLDRLGHLNLLQSADELLASAERDAEGELRRIAFDWHRMGNAVHASWSNTILGHIEIEGRRLSLQVNSYARAAEGRRLIEQALGPHVRYRVTEMVSLEREASGMRESGATLPDRAELMRDPAIQAQVAAFIAGHYESWPDQSLPALNGRSPREAMRDPDGREMVDALLRQMERDSLKNSLPGALDAIRRLRARLESH